MKIALAPYPASSTARICVELCSHTDILEIRYEIWAAETVLIPALRGAGPQRCDELWRHTCCELFAAPADRLAHDVPHDAYLEFNFAPSGDWAAYAFAARRQGMRPHEAAPPRVQVTTQRADERGRMDGLCVNVQLSRSVMGQFSRLWPTVVLETASGVSYWALRHPGEHADFHHPENFEAAVGVT